MTHTDALIEQIRASGERMTPQRRYVLEVLCGAPHRHYTISDIAKAVEVNHPGQQMNEPTVYRILQWLKDGHHIAQTDMAESGTVYQLISDPPHHHLICLVCSRVQSIEDDLFAQLRDSLLKQHSFHARMDHMAIYGVCEDCHASGGQQGTQEATG
ncbi:MAG: transcriptional repressor [Chloroflexota bacterium]